MLYTMLKKLITARNIIIRPFIRVILAHSVTCISDNQKVPTNIDDTGSNPAVAICLLDTTVRDGL